MSANDPGQGGTVPALSVILCTYNRKDLLKRNLESMISQTLDKKYFEVVVVDDGSTDGTRQVVESFGELLPVRYFYQQNAGLSSARNHGLFASRGKIVLFFDDDDTATPAFLEEHLKMHRQHPGENFAVLNHTTWHPDLEITPLMHYVTEVGCFLFSYPSLKHRMAADYTYFWGGRVSCKRSLLLNHGIFCSAIKIHYEDIELGYRLAKRAGLKVVYHAGAVSHMIRPLTFDDFCRRMMAQGQSAYLFYKIHGDPEIERYCKVEGAGDRWLKISPLFLPRVRAARELDRFATLKARVSPGLDKETRGLLYESYRWIFPACKLKGKMEALKADTNRGKVL